MIIAITGNIGSGKSEATKVFQKKGYKIINADHIGHDLYKIDRIRSKVVKRFGTGILTNDQIDRRKLKDIVFYNKKELIALNKIVHPEIIKEIKRQIKELKNKTNYILIEAALILEFKFRDYDKLLLIAIDKDQQVKRLLKKGKYNKEEINNIIDSQLSQDKKLAKADYIIDNSGTKKEFENNLTKLIKELR